MEVYEITGRVKNVKRLSQDKNSTITVTSITSQKDYHIICSYFFPVRINDVLSGVCIKQKDGMLTFVQCPIAEPGSSKEAIQNLFIIGLGKMRMNRNLSDKVYGFFQQEAIKFISKMELNRNIDVGSSDLTIYRNRDSINAAVMETISWYANNFRKDEDIAEPLITIGLTKEQAHKLLRFWYRSICLRRLYLLGLTRTEIRECCDRGWVGTKGLNNSPDALYYQLLENPYLPEKIPLAKAKDIATRYGLQFNQNIIECASLIRYVDEQTSQNGWSCFPIYNLSKQYPRFNDLIDTLKHQFKCTIRYNFLYLRHHAEIEDTIIEYLRSEPLPETHVSELTRSRLCPEQIQAVELALNNTVSAYTGSAGCGKCLSPDTIILMADGGSKYAKDITIGDQLIGDNSTIRNVLSTCSGEDNMYEIIPNKGKSFICNEPHILTLKGIMPYITMRNDRSLKYVVKYSIKGDIKNKAFQTEHEANTFISYLPEDIFDIPLNEYLLKSDNFMRYTYLFHVGVNFNEQPLYFDPYIIGLWLGDGTTNAPQITNVDIEILHYLNVSLSKYNLKLSPKTMNDISYNITGLNDNYGVKGGNHFINVLKHYNLLGNKHIPDAYKINSRQNRLKLLAGLIDSDGYVNKNCIYISQKSDLLSDDIEYLAFSLGFMVTRKKSIKSCVYKGEISEGFYNHLKIFGDGLEEIPVLLERKKCYFRKSKSRATCLRFKVKSLGKGSYCGFTLDGNGRFLLGDFLVTHNTTVISAIVTELELRDIPYIISSFTGKAVANIQEVVQRTNNVMTLHMIINKGKIYDRYNRPVEILILDEISMVPNELLAKVLIKLNNQLHPEKRLKVVLTGDPNQVQPIEWGDFCNQLMKSWIFEPDSNQGRLAIPWVQLTIDHRRRQKGVLYDNMSQFATAESPSDINFEWGQDCEYIQGGVNEIESLVKKLYQQGISNKEITIISPINNGLDNLNTKMQNIFIDDNVLTITDAFGKNWKIGDRVMMTENRYDINVMNGQEGTVINVLPEKSSIRVFFQNRQEVDIPTFEPAILNEYEFDDIEFDKPLSTKLLVLSWAITIHKSQGSQWPIVIFYIPKNMSGGNFLNRNLTYTGISRTQNHLYIVSSSVFTFIHTILVNPPSRYDNLAKRFTNQPYVEYYVNPQWEKQKEIFSTVAL